MPGVGGARRKEHPLPPPSQGLSFPRSAWHSTYFHTYVLVCVSVRWVRVWV